MLGIFKEERITTDAEYKKVLEKKTIYHRILLLVGLLTSIVIFIVRGKYQTNIPDYMLGFYTGAGGGLIIISIFLTFKNRRILNSEELIHQSRIKNTDERNLEIAGKATRISLFILLIAIYCVMFIGGLWYPVLTKALSGLVCLFLLAYCISYRVIASKM